jgi:hypothetical protein
MLIPEKIQIHNEMRPEMMAGDFAMGIKKNMQHRLPKRSLYASSSFLN